MINAYDMMRTIPRFSKQRGIANRALLCLVFTLAFFGLRAEGLHDVAPNPTDKVMLLVGDVNYGNFATLGSPESSRLYVRLNSPTETLYVGLSREFDEAGNTTGTGNYSYRIRRATNDEIIHGPFSINSFVENLSTWEDASGPAVLNGGVGYATDDERFRFSPGEAGLFYIEFIGADYIGLWDFTVGDGGVEVPGRVYSKNWAFRTPVEENDQPECVWDREFNGKIYSYTTDGFVTEIDFADSGMQGLSFTMGFNSRGPGTSGDIGLDRMSIPAQNVTDDFAEHLVFLTPPDPVLFPDGECGEITVAPFFSCTGPGTYCLQVDVTQPGQVEVILDINQNGTFDSLIDRRLLHRFLPGEPLTTCLNWDGLLGDGQPIDPGARINLGVTYSQGIQHWAVFDNEFLKDGFCVEPIRPLCTTEGQTDILYWDDRNIPDDPGTDQPKDGRAGCNCETIDCRTWNNFDPQTDDCDEIDDSITTGYGDKNTINTWWFANVFSDSRADVPLVAVEIVGDEEICAGTTTELGFDYSSNGEIMELTWTGPDGVIATGPGAPETIEVNTPGTYTLTVNEASGCSFTASHEISLISCPTDLELDISVDNATAPIGSLVTFTITVTNEGPHFAGDFGVNTNWPVGIIDVTPLTGGGTLAGSTIDWSNLQLEVGQSLTLEFMGVVAPAFDYTVYAEVSYSAQEDPDSTPGNGVDTDGDGQCADDAGDEDDGDCVAVVPPGCTLDAGVAVSSISCDNNGTGSDPNDDLFTFSLLVTGSNGSTGWSTVVNGQTISGTYGEAVTIGPLAIADGDPSLTVEDDFFGAACSQTITVPAPATCSTDCELTLNAEASTCNDNDTSYDPADDTFEFTFTIEGVNNGATWNGSDGSSGAYGTAYTFDGYPLSDGDVTLTFTDVDDPDCSVTYTFAAPTATCSPDCFLDGSVGPNICDNNGTPADPSDDTFTFTLEIAGYNVNSATWAANDPNLTIGSYDEVVTMGPYPISGGNLDFIVIDPGNPDCNLPIFIVPPPTCSNECELVMTAETAICNDNDTSYDPADDTFEFTFTIEGFNSGASWTGSDGSSGTYGTAYTFDGYPITDGDVTLTFTDVDDPGCSLTYTFAAPTATCSPDCFLDGSVGPNICNDNGTPADPSDDTFTFTLEITGYNTTTGAWSANDPNNTTGAYGTPIVMGPYAIADGNLDFLVVDPGNPDCNLPIFIVPPATCSNECELVVAAEASVCNDNGTSYDPADDTFEFTFTIEGFNSGTSWNASDGSSGTYGTSYTYDGYPISGGEVTLTFTDVDDPGCSLTHTFAAPTATCSPDCFLDGSVGPNICDNNGTPSDPSDDTFTFTLEIAGFNTTTGAWSANDPNNTTGAYGTTVVMGPYAIADGNLDFLVVDPGNPDCNLPIFIVPPQTCSEVCALTVQESLTQCNDNGTPSEVEDDTFTVLVRVTGANAGTTWTSSNGQTAPYGEFINLGPFLIADGDATVTFTDDEVPGCEITTTFTAPPACSTTCAINEAIASNVQCDDNGTPTDPSDDSFTFTVTVSGANTGDGWTADDGSAGTYDTPAEYGPYAIADGDIDLVFTDNTDEDCTYEFFQAAPPTCSDECAMTMTVSNYQCLNNGTPSDPSDDMFTFDLLVEAVNNNGASWIQPSGNNGSYGETYTQGPFPIADGGFDFVIQDVNNATCTESTAIVPPPTCSNECTLIIDVSAVVCDDAGTPEAPDDDQFFYTIVVQGINTGTTWVASDGTTGDYGVPVQSVAHSYDEGTIAVTIMDTEFDCSETIDIDPPIPALICPPDTDQRTITANIQILQGQLDTGDVLLESPPCFLELGTTPILLGDRFMEAIDMDNPDIDTVDGVFSFYFFSEIELDELLSDYGDTDGAGMLFDGSYDGYEDPCCFFMNQPDDLNPDIDMPTINPMIDTTGFFNQEMHLVSFFQQTLKPGQPYSLVTSTYGAEATGAYAWVIVSDQDVPLDINSEEVTSEFLMDQTLTEDLTYLHILWAQDNPDSQDGVGYPIVEPLCGLDSLYFLDSLEFANNCDDAYIHRTFVLEAGGQVDSCDQLLTFRRPTFDDIILPPATVTYQCGDEYEENQFGYPHPASSGYPLISSGTDYDTLFDQTIYFNILTSYKDIPLSDTTGLELNLLREWTFTDECNGDTLYVIPQQIKVGPFGPPRLVCPTGGDGCTCPDEFVLIYDVDPFECTATVDIPLAELNGFCDETTIDDWSIFTEVIRVIDDQLIDTIPYEGARTVTNLERGTYTLRYTARDSEGHVVEQSCEMRIADLQVPTAICRSSLTVNLDADGTASSVLPDELDLGSFDNCGATNLLLRRFYNEETEDCNGDLAGTFGEWTDELDLACCDAGATFPVELQVMDADSNFNHCNVLLTVVDEVAPELTGLATLELPCSELPLGFDPLDSEQRVALFGMPTLIDNCTAEITEMDPELTWDECELGSIRRRFTAMDAAGNTTAEVYEQMITVDREDTYGIRLPKDETTSCLGELPTLEFEAGGCADFSVTYTEEELTPVGEECLRLERTYLIINNCDYDGFSAPTVIRRDENCALPAGAEDVWIVVDDGAAYADADSDVDNQFPPVGQDCAINPEGYWRDLPNVGAWQYTQVIEIMDDTAPLVTYTVPETFCTIDNSCTALVSITVDVEEICLPERLEGELFLDTNNDGSIDAVLTETLIRTNNSFLIEGDFPVGEHAFVFGAIDGCANQAVERIEFTVADCFIETPTCIVELQTQLAPVIPATDLDGDGILDEAAVYISAALLASMIEDDCSGEYAYSINEPGEPADFTNDNLILTCEDRYLAVREVVVRDQAYNPYAVQPDGSLGGPNYTHCTITISVQDELEACSTCAQNELEIEGVIRNAAAEPISGVEVGIIIDDVPDENTFTVEDGKFEFPDLAFSTNYEIRPYKNDDTRNGVTTLDLILLQRHLLLHQVITDPYVLLAADITNDGAVTTLDLLWLQQLLLDNIETFPANTSWRFIPADYPLTDIAADIPDSYSYLNLLTCQFGQDFIGIKIGDLNGSASSDGILAQQDHRNDATWQLTAPDYELRNGDLYRIPIRAKDLDQLSGLELELALDTEVLKVLEIEAGQLSSEQLNTSLLQRGLLKGIWVADTGSTAASEPLFTLVVEAQGATRLAAVLALSGRTPSRAYDTALEPYRLELGFANGGQEAVLLKNHPDPFQVNTQINFYLPMAGDYQLEITDATGKTLHRYQEKATAGKQTVSVDGNGLPAGVLFYTLTFDGRQISRRMVKM